MGVSIFEKLNYKESNIAQIRIDVSYTFHQCNLGSCRRLTPMSKGFAKVSHSGNGNVAYYLREGECMAFKHPQGYDKAAILQHWQAIEKHEKLGNKDLGIRGRHDARVRTNYILSMPNSLSPNECINRVQSIIDKTPIKDCIYTTVVHKGEKDGITNQHVHLLVNERILSTQKKDREMQRKEWLDKTFKRFYEKEFKVEFSEGQTVIARERINQGLFEADRKASREGISLFQRQSETLADLTPKNVTGDALLWQSLQSFENALVADQKQMKQVAERRAEAQRQVADKQAQAVAKKQKEDNILAQGLLSLSPSFAKEQERVANDVKVQKEEVLEKECIAKAKEDHKLQETKKEQIKQTQAIKEEKVKETPVIRMRF